MRFLLTGFVCLLFAASVAAQEAAANSGASGRGVGIPSGPPKVAFGLPILTEDRSLSLAAYEAAGVPALDRRWGLEEYEQAAQALTAIAEQGAGELPRLNSPGSGPLLQHLFDPANFPNPAEYTTLAETEAALTQLRALSAGPLIQITDAYLMGLNEGFSQPNELCAAIGFVAQVLPVAHALANQATAQGRPEDPRRVAALEESSVDAIVNAVGLLRLVGDDAIGAKGALLARVAPAYRKIRPRLSAAANTRVQIVVERALNWEVSEPILTQLRYMHFPNG